MATSLYVHVPFCVVKCGYCDFVSYVPDAEDALDDYLDHLERELALVWIPREPVSVFFGGGTPSYLNPDQLQRLFALIAARADLSACSEVTMEANPESLTQEKAHIARAAGVNRASVGAQSFAPRWLQFLDRAHDADATRAAVAALRAADFDNVSLDLMFALPGQTPDEWLADLRAALALQPDHLSCYNLTFETGTRLGREHARGELAANPEPVDREMFLATRQVLAEHDFRAYEISNFAGRGGVCRHNDHYWLQGDSVGVGPGAASHRAGIRSTNLKTLDAWARSIDAGVPPVADAEALDRSHRLREALWLGIRRRDGVRLSEVCARLETELQPPLQEALQTLRAEKLLAEDDDVVRLTPQGLLLADTVGERLLRAP